MSTIVAQVERVCDGSEDGNTSPLEEPSKCADTRKDRVNPSKYWFVTVFNNEMDKLIYDLDNVERGTRYIICREICPTTKNEHFHIYCEFEKRIRWSEKPAFVAWKANWGRSVTDKIDKTEKPLKFKEARDSAIRYCMKDGDFIIKGLPPPPMMDEDICDLVKIKYSDFKRLKDESPIKCKYRCCEFVIFGLMYKSKRIKAIKSIKLRTEFIMHIYNMTFPGSYFLSEVPTV